MQYETETETRRDFKTKSNYSRVPYRRSPTLPPPFTPLSPPLLIIFLIFLHPEHSYSSLQSINYWEKFRNQKNFLKQYTYAYFFVISQKK